MTTATHTPGEWRAVFRGMDQAANWASRIPYAIERVVGNAVQPIADVCDQPEAEGNARLIAAAPAMFAALKQAQAQLVFADRLLDCQDEIDAVTAALAAASAA